MAQGARVEKWALGALALGVALRLLSPFYADFGYDASAYVAMAHGLAERGELLMAWGDVLTFAPSGEGHSHHFPPGYPFYLAAVFEVFGYGLAQAKFAAVAMSLAALAVAYATTRDLYGRTPAAVVAGLLALDPHLLWVTAMGFSENLALALFTLTMWAILRSLRDERWIVLAGIFAGLAYLTRASMGAFFVIAGGGGFAWRLWHRGWRGVASPWYALGIALFALIVGAWAWRNVALFGDWQTSPGAAGIPRWIWEHRTWFAVSALVRAPLLAFVLAPFVWALWPEARRSIAKWRDEHTSGLWLSIGLAWVLGLIFSAAYMSMGTWIDAFRIDNMRYVLIALAPLAWALARELRFDEKATRVRLGALGVTLLLLCGALLAFPPQYLPAQAGRAIDPFLEPGDRIGIEGAGKYPFYAYLSRPQDVTTFSLAFAPDQPEWIVALSPLSREGYVLLGEKTMTHPIWPFQKDYVAVHARADVVEDRRVELAPMRTGL